MKTSLLTISVLIAITGCATDIKTSNDSNAIGLRYPLPVNQLELTVVQTKKYPKDIAFNATQFINLSGQDQIDEYLERYLKDCYNRGEGQQENRLDKANALRIADWENVHTIAVEPKFFSEDNITINRSDLGWLKSVNVTTDGQGDEVLKQSLNIAGTVSGFTSIGATSLPVSNLVSEAFYNSINKNRISELAEYQKLPPESRMPDEVLKINCANIRIGLLKHFEIKDFIKDDTPKSVELAVFHGYADSMVFKQSAKLKETIKQLNGNIVDLAIKLGQEPDTTKLGNLRAELKAKKEALTLQENTANAYSAVLANAQQKINNLYNTKPVETKTLVKTFEISDLIVRSSKVKVGTEEEQGKEARSADNATPKIAEKMEDEELTLINSNPKFQELGVAITLERPGIKVQDSGQGSPQFKDDAMLIAYRDPEVFFATVHVFDSGKWVKKSTEPMVLISKDTPTGYIEYKNSDWSKQSMGLTFNDNGVLTDVSYTKESGAVNLATALDQGATNYITKLKEAQAARVEINNASRAEYQASLQFEIDKLKKQEELLAARSSLDLNSNETALELAAIKQKIESYEQQKLLLDAQSDFSIAQQTSPLNTNEELLKAKLSLFQAQQNLSNQEATSSALANQLATLSSIGQLQQQLVGTQDEAEIKDISSKLNRLEIQLNVLLKELELRGVVNASNKD